MEITNFKSQTSKSGFTLVEVVTVVMIIAILMGATTSAISGARRTAMRTHTRDTCRQLAAAWTSYVTDQGSFPASGKFKNGAGEDTYAASPYNIGALLNTQYQRDGKTPLSTSLTYYDTTKEECEPSGSAPNYSWPELNDAKNNGIRDKWKHVIYFTLDFDLDGRLPNQVSGKQVSASALAFSTERFKLTDMGKYGSKFIVAW